jgi:Transcription elongation factor, GreA/GreB, C-term
MATTSAPNSRFQELTSGIGERGQGDSSLRDRVDLGLLRDPRGIEVHDTVHIENVVTGLPEVYTIVPAPLPGNADEMWIDDESPLGSALIGGRTGEEIAFHGVGAIFRYRVIEILSPPRLRPVDASGDRRMEREEVEP